MIRAAFVFLGMAALQLAAAETFTAWTGAHYATTPGYTWTEVDGIKIGSDGRVSIAGTLAPFQKYQTVEGGYYAVAQPHIAPPALVREEFTYAMNADRLTRTLYTAPPHEAVAMAEIIPDNQCAECKNERMPASYRTVVPKSSGDVIVIVKEGEREIFQFRMPRE